MCIRSRRDGGKSRSPHWSPRNEEMLPGVCACSRPFPGLLQNYIARFGHGSAKLARQAQSKEKTLQKMMASGLTERVVSDKVGLTRSVRWLGVQGLKMAPG